MSRSNNTEVINPSVRWFEWNGEKGNLRYYDKDSKTNIEIPLPFQFIVLDQLSTVKGWHDASESGIYANEIRDTKKERLFVKSFKGGEIAEGFYSDIKDRIKANGAHFVSNIYIAFKNTDNVFYIGSLQFKGAALNSWAEFRNKNRKAIMEKAVIIHSSVEGKKGKVTFYTPDFKLNEISAGTQEVAIELDKELQEYLTTYLQRKPLTEQVESKYTPDQEQQMLSKQHEEMILSQEEINDLPF